MTHIVHLTNVHPWRDTRIFLKMCSSLAEDGFKVSLIAIDRNTAKESRFTENGVEVTLLPGNHIKNRIDRAIKGGHAVVSAGIETGADIFHIHDPELIAWIPYLRLRRRKVIFDAHEDFVAQNDSRDWASGWRKLPIQIIAGSLRFIVNRTSSHILTATQKIAESHPVEKTTVINNFPIIGELRSADNVSRPLSERPKRGIYVGGMNEIRGLREIVLALPFADNIEGVDLVGEFQDPDFLEELKNLPGWKKITHHGTQPRESVAKLMAQARFGIVTFHPLPNHIDAQPNKLFEYLSAGLLILHSDFPLWNAITKAPYLGRSCSPLEPKSLANEMDMLVDDPSLDKKGDDAVSIIETTYNWPSEVKKLIAVVNTL